MTVYLTVFEVAQRLRISPSSIRRLIKSGALAAHRFGSRVVIGEDDLARFTESCRVGGGVA
jgi:excisionase family DNA binding protein